MSAGNIKTQKKNSQIMNLAHNCALRLYIFKHEINDFTPLSPELLTGYLRYATVKLLNNLTI